MSAGSLNGISGLFDSQKSSVMPDVGGFNDLCRRLLREYNDKLLDAGFGYRLSALKKMNMIDVRNLLDLSSVGNYMIPKITQTKEEMGFSEQHGWFSVIPCFSQGVLRVNSFHYIYFEVEDLDPYQQEMKVSLRDYMKSEAGWEVGVLGTTMIKATANAHHVEVVPINYSLFQNLYLHFSQEEMGWSDTEWKTWNYTILAHAQEEWEKLRKRDTDNFMELIKIFMYCITKANYALEKYKPSRPLTLGGKKSNRKTTEETPTESQVKKVRTVGPITIQSEKIPRLPSKENIIHYKVASWTTRGHLRHYKSGKVTYVKEAVHKRQCMQNEKDPAAATIRFKEKK